MLRIINTPYSCLRQNTVLHYAILSLLATNIADASIIAPLKSLKGISPPSVPGLLESDSSRTDIITPIVVNKTAAIALGKALFWDQAIGSDGQACASCHFQAGADARAKNQINPGTAHGRFTYNPTKAGYDSKNYPLRFHDFPFRPDNDNVTSSSGVFDRNNFKESNSGSIVDSCDPILTSPFNVNGTLIRKVEPRNSPTMINATYNFRNFWDGRANNIFNGVNPFGMRDKTAGVYINTNAGIQKKPLNLINSSLASQAVGPIGSIFEMACDNRSNAAIGRKVLNRRPLSTQTIHPEDSVLSNLPSLIGSSGVYTDLVRAAFASNYWNSTQTFNGYNQMESNFAMFFGLAVQLYEATLVSDDSKFDRVKQGTATFTPQEGHGFNIFNTSGTVYGGGTGANCVSCHSGALFTSAANDTNNKDILIERMMMKDSKVSLYDKGFYNLGVVPNDYDIGLGGLDPFGNPLSFSEQYKNSKWVDPFKSRVDADACRVETPMANCSSVTATQLAAERTGVIGNFKVPSLRNVELTGPYMHNGSLATLDQVVDFYARGGNFDNYAKHPDIKPIEVMVRSDKNDLVAFLKTLTDERVAYEKAPFDHPSLTVFNGHPGNSSQVTAGNAIDNRLAADTPVLIPAVGKNGRAERLKPFHEQISHKADDSDIVNLALYKKVGPYSAVGYGIVDGETGNFGSDGGATIGGGGYPTQYLEVDLGDSYALEHIDLFNDNRAHWRDVLKNFYVFVSETPMEGKALSTLVNDASIWRTKIDNVLPLKFDLPAKTRGRYVRIHLNFPTDTSTYGFLHEIEVYGRPNSGKAYSSTARWLNKDTPYAGAGSSGYTTKEARMGFAVSDGDFKTFASTTLVGSSVLLDYTKHWLEVNLGYERDLSKVVVWTGNPNTPPKNFYVFVSKTPLEGRVYNDILNDPTVWRQLVTAPVTSSLEVALPVGTSGQFVRVQSTGNDKISYNGIEYHYPMSAGELQVFGR